jgi:hypothetical protein
MDISGDFTGTALVTFEPSIKKTDAIPLEHQNQQNSVCYPVTLRKYRKGHSEVIQVEFKALNGYFNGAPVQSKPA